MSKVATKAAAPRKDRPKKPPKRCATCRTPMPGVGGVDCPGCKAERRRLRDLHQGRVGPLPGDGVRVPVRCLGVGCEETFFTASFAVRFCPRCRERRKGQSISPHCERPVRYLGDR